MPDMPAGTLRTLCIASFVNTGLFLVIYGLGVLSMAAVRDIPYEEYESLFLDRVAAFADPALRGEVEEVLLLMHQHGVLLMMILFARTALRFYGALGMWRGRPNGFHIYAFAQLVGIFAPHLVLPWKFLGIGGPVAAVVITAWYGSLVRKSGPPRK